MRLRNLAWLAAAAVAIAACSSPMERKTMPATSTRDAVLGDWASLAPELRPSAARNPDGSAKPFYLRREFRALAGDRFELTVLNSADPYGTVPLARIFIRGHMAWRGPHPIAPGAESVDFTADEAYEVTPLAQGFADVLNRVAATGYAPWAVGASQSIFGKAFAPFGLQEGQIFKEYDLVFLGHGLLFWGARHVDGRGFDTEANRPTNLQIPMIRK